MFDFLAHDPGRHGIDVEAEHVAADAVRLEQRRAAAHEGIGTRLARKIVGAEKDVAQRAVAEFRQGQTAKQRAGPAGKPFMHGDDRPVILLNLFFLQGQGGDEREYQSAFRCSLTASMMKSSVSHIFLSYRHNLSNLAGFVAV